MYIAGTPGYRCTVHKEFILQVLQAIMYMRTLLYIAGTPGYNVQKEFILQVLQAIMYIRSLYCRYSRLSSSKGVSIASTPGYHVQKDFILQVLQAIMYVRSLYFRYSLPPGIHSPQTCPSSRPTQQPEHQANINISHLWATVTLLICERH